MQRESINYWTGEESSDSRPDGLSSIHSGLGQSIITWIKCTFVMRYFYDAIQLRYLFCLRNVPELIDILDSLSVHEGWMQGYKGEALTLV